MTKLELMRIGVGLMFAVRNNLKYSTNTPALYEQVDLSSQYYKKLSQDFRALRSNLNNILHTRKHAELALKYRAGMCDEMGTVATYLGSMAVNTEEPVYITALFTPTHVFCLIHQDEALAKIDKRQKYVDGLKELSEVKSLKNAVIVDPWIYAVTCLSDWEKHIKHAESYDPSGFFSGVITTLGYSEKLSRVEPSPDNKRLQRIIRDFNTAYNYAKNSIHEGNINSPISIQFDDLKEKLKHDIDRRRTLVSLRNFISRLRNQSSSWYSDDFRSDRKGIVYGELIKCIDKALKRNMDINDDNLKKILEIALDVTVIVRGKQSPENLSKQNLDMTSTALSLLNPRVLPEHQCKFESIDGRNLQRIRDIRTGEGSDREKYCMLVVLIRGEDGINESLYTADGKQQSYDTAHAFTLSRKAAAGLLFYDAEVDILNYHRLLEVS
ncbi:hypothetical protein L3V86_00145 [Thiotrichales bacterium 19S11-10]|nr:hypothetical protein [Thiotrichales bacterium 19S11-10]